jgi:hypothetical protein
MILINPPLKGLNLGTWAVALALAVAVGFIHTTTTVVVVDDDVVVNDVVH